MQYKMVQMTCIITANELSFVQSSCLCDSNNSLCVCVFFVCMHFLCVCVCLCFLSVCVFLLFFLFSFCVIFVCLYVCFFFLCICVFFFLFTCVCFLSKCQYFSSTNIKNHWPIKKAKHLQSYILSIILGTDVHSTVLGDLLIPVSLSVHKQ